MRPVVSLGMTGDTPNSAKLVWAEKVGLSPQYAWGGPQQVALADIVMVEGKPALVRYERNLSPTPLHPDGRGLWSNPDGDTVLGAGYEAFAFSADGEQIFVATDAFFSTSSAAVSVEPHTASQAFTDSTVWSWRAPYLHTNVTRYDPPVYGYVDNGYPYPVSKYGHWEEMILPISVGGVPAFAFTSSANLDPPWSDFESTFGLETWILAADRSAPAVQATHLNEPADAPRMLVYPTAFNPQLGGIYVSVAPFLSGAANAPGALFLLCP
jgi:hypothetical protein